VVDKYLCNLIIPGAPKSGTGSLHSALAKHPQICGSEPKEPQFFSFEERFSLGAKEHNKLFFPKPNVDYYCEGSQCYFAHPQAVERIRDFLECPKIIILLREPIERLISQYTWNYKRGTETSTIEDAIRYRGESNEYIYDDRINSYREVGGYLSFSRYSKWLPLWQKEFGKENVLVLKFEDFKIDQPRVLSKCFSFLGLDEQSFAQQHAVNKTKDTKAVVFSPALLRLSGLLPISLKKRGAYQNFKSLLIRGLTRQPRSVSNETISRLTALLDKDINLHAQLPSAFASDSDR